MFRREVSAFFVPGQRILSLTSDNTPGGVAFDFFSIKEQLWKMPYDNLCMVHTHGSLPEMSGIDWNMVYGWCMGFGVPIIYVVVFGIPHGWGRICYRCQQTSKKSIERTPIDWLESNGHYFMLEKVVWDLSTHHDDVDKQTESNALRFLRLLAPYPKIGARQNGKEE